MMGHSRISSAQLGVQVRHTDGHAELLVKYGKGCKKGAKTCTSKSKGSTNCVLGHLGAAQTSS